MPGTRKVRPEATAIGTRLAMIRKRRGWSQNDLAGFSGLTKGYISQLENGKRGFERRSLIELLAHTLGCSVVDLTGEPYLPVDRASAEGLAAIPGIELALHDCTLDDVPDIAARPVDQLVAAMTTANGERDQVHYGTAGRELGALLTELQVVAVTGNSDDQRRALASLAEAGIVAYELSKNLGHPALAAEAAERGHQAAKRLGDPTLVGFAAWYRALALIRIGAHRRAANALADAIAEIQPLADPTIESSFAAEVYGLLHLTSAAHAARQARAEDAQAHLAEAAAIAKVTGERNSLFQHFGPTNVALWSISVGVELCEGAKLAERASRIDTSVLGSRNREAALQFDLARAYSQEGGARDWEAVQRLDAADRAAPSRIRQDPIARSLLDALENRSRVKMWEIGSLRHRFGLRRAQG